MGCHAHSCTSSIKCDCPKVGLNEFFSDRQINTYCFLPSDFWAQPYPSWILRLPDSQRHLSPGLLASPSQLRKPGWQRVMAQAPWLCVLYFHLQCLHRGRPGLSQAAVWAPQLGRSVRGGDSVCVYKFLGQGEVTAVQAVISKCWTKDCNISAL